MKRLKRVAIGLAAIVAIITAVACGPQMPSPGELEPKATTPGEVLGTVEVGMTVSEVTSIIDKEYLVQNDALIVVNFSSLQIVGGGIKYQPTKDSDSPYYGWLVFDVIVQDLEPALIGFESDGDTVVVVRGMPFDTAQHLVEEQYDKPFRRQWIPPSIASELVQGMHSD